jgi:predicted GNAT family acetyltransferase
MKFNIKHDTKSQKFYTIIGGKECSLKYEKINDQLFNFKMMFVPKNLRAQGIASRIMEFSLNYVRKNMIKVKASCSFVESYMYNHKEHTDLIYNREELVLNME